MTESRNTTALRAARDQLLQLSGDYAAAMREFHWPTLDESFNWATDWFDVQARGNDAIALHIVEEDGREQQVTFDEMARRSDQVAVWLEGVGHRCR